VEGDENMVSISIAGTESACCRFETVGLVAEHAQAVAATWWLYADIRPTDQAKGEEKRDASHCYSSFASSRSVSLAHTQQSGDAELCHHRHAFVGLAHRHHCAIAQSSLPKAPL
jgi:hypothetical protein